MARFEVAGAAGAALLLAVLLSIEIGAPWVYIHDDNGAWTQAVATAHLRAGLQRTRGQDFFMRRADGGLDPYLHHPPLYPLLQAAVFRVTGSSSPLTTRAVPALFHLLGFAGTFVLARRLFPSRPDVRLGALYLYATVPMSTFFGKVAFNEPVGLAWMVWALVFTLRFRATTRAMALLPAVGLWLLALATSWPCAALLFAFWLLQVWDWRHGQPGAGTAAVVLGATGLAGLAIVLGQLAWVAGGGLTSLFQAGDAWGIYGRQASSWLRALGVAFDSHRFYFANVPFVFYLGWLVTRARGRGRSLTEAERVLLAGSFGAALWAVVFVHQVGMHGYGQFWFLPFETLAAADAAACAWRGLATRPRWRTALAALAVAGTVVSSAAVLHYRYTHRGGYAMDTTRAIEARYYTHP